MPRRRPAELHINHERWLVSYADFITLLFAFFVVMYSISQVSESKYRVLSSTLMEAFEPARSLRPIQVGDLSRTPSTSAIDIRGDERGDTDRPELGEALSPDLTEPAGLGALGELGERIGEHFAELIGDDLVTVHANEYWLQIELRDSILFGSGSADPSVQAQEIFSEMAGLLADYDNPVQIEGHTDDRPISNLRYPSNWELSTARASAIVKLLMDSGVNPRRLSAVGYGEHQPAATNETEAGRALNRRVTLMIAREAVERPSAPLDGVDPGTLPPRQSAPSGEVAPEVSPGAQEQGEGADNASGNIEPVQLESGGLLFSSDPDLPRE